MRQNFINVSVLFILCFAVSVNGHTQGGNDESSEVEDVKGLFALQAGIPSKAMQPAVKNNMGNLGFGAGLRILTNPFTWGRNKRDSPLRLGAESGYTYYGRFLSDVNINGYHGDYKTSYGILQLNALLQLRPQRPEIISPFIEIFAGGSFYLSSTKENLDVIESGLGIQAFEIGNYSSASFNKGIALGCNMGKVKRDKERVTIRLSCNWGTDIKYVVRNSLEYNPYSGSLEYTVGKAPVKYLMAQVGIGF